MLYGIIVLILAIVANIGVFIMYGPIMGIISMIVIPGIIAMVAILIEELCERLR